MKYLQSFSLFESRTPGTLTPEQEEFLNRNTKGTWSVNPSTGLVDVQGSFLCSKQRLKSMYEIRFGTVTEDFYCNVNQLTTLEGAPETVEGNFWGDAFDLGPGQWNLAGWLEVLRTGSPEAQNLISTIIGADGWNSEISSNPVETLLRLAALWDRLPEDIRGGIKIPSGLQDDFDNFLDLERAGVY